MGTTFSSVARSVIAVLFYKQIGKTAPKISRKRNDINIFGSNAQTRVCHTLFDYEQH